MRKFGKDLLINLKNADLKGEDAHCIYSPAYRPLFSYDDILTKNPKFVVLIRIISELFVRFLRFIFRRAIFMSTHLFRLLKKIQLSFYKRAKLRS